MFTHDSIWLAIDHLANSLGYSTSGLAKRAGLDPTTFNRSKRLGPDGKPRWPSTESIARVLDSTNSTMADFLSLIEAGTTGHKTQAMIPLLGLTQALQDHHFDINGAPKGSGWDMIHFPHPQGIEQKIYALEIGTDIIHPFFRAGDRLIVVQDAAIRRGDRVVVKTQSGDLLLQELVRQTAGKIDLKSLTAPHTETSHSMKNILWVARIVWISQ